METKRRPGTVEKGRKLREGKFNNNNARRERQGDKGRTRRKVTEMEKKRPKRNLQAEKGNEKERWEGKGEKGRKTI